MAGWLDIGIKISVPLIILALSAVTSLLWGMNDRLTRLESNQKFIVEKLASMPPKDYRDLMALQFKILNEKLDDIRQDTYPNAK